MTARRDFLRGLVALPLVGGSVSLIGQPTAAAVPVTPDLIEAYKTWLDFEMRSLTWQMAGDPVFIERYRDHPVKEEGRIGLSDAIGRMLTFVGQSGSYHYGAAVDPYPRAAVVLSAVGCDWREKRR